MLADDLGPIGDVDDDLDKFWSSESRPLWPRLYQPERRGPSIPRLKHMPLKRRYVEQRLLLIEVQCGSKRLKESLPSHQGDKGQGIVAIGGYVYQPKRKRNIIS